MPDDAKADALLNHSRQSWLTQLSEEVGLVVTALNDYDELFLHPAEHDTCHDGASRAKVRLLTRVRDLSDWYNAGKALNVRQ
jgi:2,3-bisphosphoglycerate-independent phosphoglycerate mutase